MSLSVDIEKKLGAFHLRSQFEAPDETMALLGASGCGKSMTLECIAGIVTPDRGRIVLGDRVLFDSEKKINLPPQQRKVFLPFGLRIVLILFQGVVGAVQPAHLFQQQECVRRGIVAGGRVHPPPQQMLPLPQQLPIGAFTSGRHFRPPVSPPPGRQWRTLSGCRPVRRW